MSDDETRPIELEAPVPPPAAPAGAQWAARSAGQPAFAMPLPAGYPAYVVPQGPWFADQVMGMRAVVATSLACLIVGGVGGYALGHAAGGDDHGFGGRGPGFFQQRGAFPNGQAPHGQAHHGQAPGSRNGIPQQRFDGQNPNTG